MDVVIKRLQKCVVLLISFEIRKLFNNDIVAIVLVCFLFLVFLKNQKTFDQYRTFHIHHLLK